VNQLLFKIFLFTSTICLSLILLTGCEKKYDSIVDSAGRAPVISDAKFSLSVVNTDTINVGTERKPDDELSIRGIASIKVINNEDASDIGLVQCSVYKDLSSSSIGNDALHDDGIFPDQTIHDNIYSGYVGFKINRVDVGKYWIAFCGESNAGYIYHQDQHYQSSTISLPFQIVRLNRPPFLSNLQMDTLIYLGGVDHYLQLRIAASDSDGQSDIRQVFFNSFKPNGLPSSGNPYYMYDDGNENQSTGDLIKGDGIYGLIISLPKKTIIGTYRFEFHTVDQSLNSSIVLIQNITVRK
jgi:hypothetical protein